MTDLPTASPWGTPQTTTEIASGIFHVSTASHGGILLDPERNLAVPEYMRRADRAYEEDIDWAIPFVVFADDFARHAQRTGESSDHPGQRDLAIRTLREWRPDHFEKFFGVALSDDESYVRRMERFARDNADRFVSVQARPSSTPGMVLVTAERGFTVSWRRYPRPDTVERRDFLVPEAKYRASARMPFVIDERRHVEVLPEDPMAAPAPDTSSEPSF